MRFQSKREMEMSKMTDEARKDEGSSVKRVVNYFESKGLSEEEALVQTADIFDKLERIFEELKDERKMKELEQEWKKRNEETFEQLKHCIDEMKDHGKLITIDVSESRIEEFLAKIKEYAQQKGAEIIDVRGNLEETRKIVEKLYYKYDSDEFSNKIVILKVSDFNEVAKNLVELGGVINFQMHFSVDYELDLREGLVIIIKDDPWYGGRNEDFLIC